MPDDANPTPPAGRLDYARPGDGASQRFSIRDWFEGPIHPVTCIYLVVVSAPILWWSRLPPTGDEGIVRPVVAMLACGPIVVRLLIGAMLQGPASADWPLSPRTIIFFFIALIVPLAVLIDLPLSITFGLSQASMDRLAARAPRRHQAFRSRINGLDFTTRRTFGRSPAACSSGLRVIAAMEAASARNRRRHQMRQLSRPTILTRCCRERPGAFYAVRDSWIIWNNQW